MIWAVSEDIFVFVARDQAPAEGELQAALATMKRVSVEVDVAAEEMIFEPGEVAYVEAVVGPFRLDTIRYRAGAQPLVADLLDRCYSQAKALADPDADGIFPIPELVSLMRSMPESTFHPWADPTERS